MTRRVLFPSFELDETQPVEDPEVRDARMTALFEAGMKDAEDAWLASDLRWLEALANESEADPE